MNHAHIAKQLRAVRDQLSTKMTARQVNKAKQTLMDLSDEHVIESTLNEMAQAAIVPDSQTIHKL